MNRCDQCVYWKFIESQTSEEFYDPHPDVQAGYCRRFPPVNISIEDHEIGGTETFRWSQPQTFAEDWCGEFKGKR